MAVVIDDNGFNPVWKETFEFDVHEPELALLKFFVYETVRTSACLSRFSTQWPTYNHRSPSLFILYDTCCCCWWLLILILCCVMGG